MEKPKGKSTWSIIIKVIIAVATAIGGVLGILFKRFLKERYQIFNP